MYAAGSVLKLKKPKSKPAREGKEAEPFPYDKVKVIGTSPTQHGNKGLWEGQDAVGVIIQPLTSFGGVLDEPFGKLRELYTVESQPDVTQQAVRVFTEQPPVGLGPSPEEQFADAVPAGTKKSLTRVKTPHSPLEEVVPAAEVSPLDE